MTLSDSLSVTVLVGLKRVDRRVERVSDAVYRSSLPVFLAVVVKDCELLDDFDDFVERGDVRCLDPRVWHEQRHRLLALAQLDGDLIRLNRCLLLPVNTLRVLLCIAVIVLDARDRLADGSTSKLVDLGLDWLEEGRKARRATLEEKYVDSGGHLEFAIHEVLL